MKGSCAAGVLLSTLREPGILTNTPDSNQPCQMPEPAMVAGLPSARVRFVGPSERSDLVTHTNQQSVKQFQLAEWRQLLDEVDQAVDAAYWTLAALSERASATTDSDEIANITSDIYALIAQWESRSVSIDEITTYERVHDLV